MSVFTMYLPAGNDVFDDVIWDKSVVQSPQPLVLKPLSVGAMVTTVGLLVVSLAMISLAEPPKPLRRSQ
jgi:hypothetical protein